MKTITKICKWCNKEFLAESREVKRGGGIFCSLSCGAKFNNNHRELTSHTCQFCKLPYDTTAKRSLYCSKTCSRKARRERNVKSGAKNTNRSTLQSRVIKFLSPKQFKCFICGWQEAFCDIHHITPRSLGGQDSFDNLTVLCPNHHRLADRGKLTTLPSVSERYRTISSS